MKIIYYIILGLIYCVGNSSAQDLRFSYQVTNPVYAQSKLIVYVQKASPGTENLVGFNFGFFYQGSESTVQGYAENATDPSIVFPGETGPFLDMSYAATLGWNPAWNSGSIVTVPVPPNGLPSGYNRRINCAIDDNNAVGALIGTTPVPIVAITLNNTIGTGPIHLDSTYQLAGDIDAAITYFTGEDEFLVQVVGTRLQPLPIELVTFKAEKYNDRSAYLSWTTASEINSSHFMVQRSFDKKTWSNAGKVTAAGNSQIIQQYSFVDEGVYNGIDSRVNVYYRLQMFDLDGRNNFSPIEKVIFGTDATRTAGFVVSLYPNPATDGVYVGWDNQLDNQPTLLEMYDISGKLILTHKVADNSSKEYIDFGSSRIHSGVYQLRVLSGSETLDYKQVVVGQNR